MFRQQALEYKKNSWRGRALLLPGIPFWLSASLSFLLVFIFLTFIICGSYTRRVSVIGEISTYPRAANVYSAVQGVVVERFVNEGETIHTGNPLYLIDVSKSTRSGIISENQRRNLDNQLVRIAKIISRLEDSKRSTVAMLGKQKEQYSSAYARSSDLIRQAKEGVGILKKNMENYEKYRSQGLINKDQLTNHIAIYYQQQNNLLGLSAQNEQNALQITALESQLHTQAADFDNQIHQMELKRYELEKELQQIDASGEIIVRAMSEGRVDSLSVTVGQMVNIGDSLLQILPQKIDYYALVIWVPNDAIPYISVGDKMNIRYDAFPAEKFGQFSGRISVISKAPASSQEMQTYRSAPKDVQSTQPYYKVIVRPEKQSVFYNNKRLSLENGMRAESVIFLEKRKIYQWILSPFYNMKFSATGPVNE